MRVSSVKVAVIDPEAPSAGAVMEEARKFMIATFYKEAVVPLALGLTADNDEMRRVFTCFRAKLVFKPLFCPLPPKKFLLMFLTTKQVTSLNILKI